MKNLAKGSNDNFTPVSRSAKNPGKAWVVPAMFKVVLILGCLFLAMATRVHFTAQTESLNREAVKIKSQLQRLELEKANLRNKKEELSSWKHINSRIEKYKLALRPATRSQIKELKLVDIEARHTRAASTSLASLRPDDVNSDMRAYTSR